MVRNGVEQCGEVHSSANRTLAKIYMILRCHKVPEDEPQNPPAAGLHT